MADCMPAVIDCQLGEELVWVRACSCTNDLIINCEIIITVDWEIFQFLTIPYGDIFNVKH